MVSPEFQKIGGFAMEEQEIGYVSNFYKNISVAAVEITAGSIAVNDTLHIKGHSTDLELTVDSIQIEHESVTEAKQGDGIGLKVPERVRRKDRVYKIIE
jgi:translation elongation factor EF-1alpha